ncbi:MAG TPA: PaaI family thioesterase [Myxococcota bacterium]|nr:PaaI family thioesterase [Myxococcota bacterium]
MKSLQDTYAPNNQCFGCGPSNPQGLQIKSMVEGDVVVASFVPKSYHQAFDNVLSGGICGTLLDCHSNWCAAYFIMEKRGEKNPPCTVTARYAVNLLLPTPMDKALTLTAKPKLVTDRKAEIIAELSAHGKVTATCEGLFVAVQPGHPAYHRW